MGRNTFLALGTCICLLLSVRAAAVSASPEGATITQPDGAQFVLQLRGDEFFSWHETRDGYAVVKDPSDGYWKYATPSSSSPAFEAISSARVGSSSPAAMQLRKHALPARELLKKQIQRQRRAQPNQAVANTASSALSSPEAPPAPHIPASGVTTVRNIVILACFNDHWDTTNSTVLASKGRVDTSEYDDLFNKTGYSADGAVGSVKDYYAEVSYGKLTLASTITPWVRLPQNEAYYGASDDANAAQMVTDAINAADAAGVDFSGCDADGDGWVDCVTIIHSGYGEEYSGNSANCIWSHQGQMDAISNVDGVNMLRYHTEPALRGLSTSGATITRIGVVCHETGHFLGLPDLYDYSSITDGLGSWCIMSGGSWNGSDGKRPAHFSAYAKYMLGFVGPQQIHSASPVSIPRVEDNAAIHLFRDGTSNGEYFLIENRENWGFDNDAAIHPGILIYHIDSKSENDDLGTWAHPLVKVEEADGDDSLGSSGASSEAGDAWTNTSGLAGGFRDQTGNQSTNAMLYQSTHDYNRANLSAYYSYVRVNTFSAPGATMTYTTSTLKPTVYSQTTASPDYTVSWGACTNATQYELQEGTPVTLTSFSDGAEDADAQFDNWYCAGTVTRDNSGAHAGSYSYAMHQYFNSRWYSSVQSITQRNTFKALAGTTISYYTISHLVSGNGYLKCQISNDGGNTWATLGTYSGTGGSWTLRSHNFSALSAAGISANDNCILRFVTDFEYAYGLATFPGYGFAVDDISIANTQIASYGNWSTLSNTIPSASYAVTGRSSGIHAYRARAYANSAWQGYGSIGTATVNTSYSVSFQTDATPGATLTGTTPQTVSAGGNCAPVTANAPTGYHFLKWTKSGSDYSVSNPLTVTNVQETMTLTAVFAANQYTVTFDAESGTTPSPQTKLVTFDATYGALATTSRTGYFFAGWWTLSSGGTEVLSGTTVTTAADHTLYAHWTPNTYTVTFDAQGGTTPSPQTIPVTFDATYGALATTSRTGYAFAGWWTDPSGGTEILTSTTVTAAADHTLYAHWTPNTYTVTFDAQSGTTPNPQTKQVTFASTYGALATTSRNGYSFVGWWTDPSNGTEVVSSTTVSTAADHTLYAHWTPNTYTVTFDAQGGTTPSPETRLVTFDATYGALATTSRNGYAFAGWWTDPSSGTEVLSGTTVTTAADHTLYAHWTPNAYTVTFDAQGGTTPSPETQLVTFDAIYGTLATTSRAGYSFAGWRTDPLSGTEVLTSTTVTAAADHTLYAHWTPNGYTVTFDTQGGTTPSPETRLVTFDATYGALATTSRNGYAFAGWWTDPSSGTEVLTSTTVTAAADHTLYAHWTPNTYTVTFDAQGGTTPSPETQLVTFDAIYGTLATTSRAGYAFAGWWTDPSSGTEVLSGTTVTTAADHTLYAHWTPNAYTVTFDAQGGTTPSPETKPVTFDATYGELATTSRAGFAFAGWWTDPSGGSEVVSTTTLATASDHTLYAHWTADAYRVEFQTDGTPGAALVGTTTQIVAFESDCTAVTANAPVGYHFVKWTSGGSDFSTANPLTVTNVTQSMTLVATFGADLLQLIDQPAPQIEVSLGGSITLSVSVTGGSGTVRYAWFKEDSHGARTDLGIETPSLSLSDISAADEGAYYCEVSDELTTLSTDGSLLVVRMPLPAATALGTTVLAILLLLIGLYRPREQNAAR